MSYSQAALLSQSVGGSMATDQEIMKRFVRNYAFPMLVAGVAADDDDDDDDGIAVDAACCYSGFFGEISCSHHM